MINNTRAISWKQKHLSLSSAMKVTTLNSNVFWLTQSSSSMRIGAVTFEVTHVF